jgi:NADH:ubiquinone oxidoreductase subunit 3 (subunit A)
VAVRAQAQRRVGWVPYDRIILAVFMVLGAAFVVVTLGASWLLSPKKPSPEKAGTYECGVEPVGPPWVQFHAGYYVYALLFVIFDIETVFLYPWALVYGARGWFIFSEMVLFVVILVAGLAYAWKEGALHWR